jgi:hypothetical protein
MLNFYPFQFTKFYNLSDIRGNILEEQVDFNEFQELVVHNPIFQRYHSNEYSIPESIDRYYFMDSIDEYPYELYERSSISYDHADKLVHGIFFKQITLSELLEIKKIADRLKFNILLIHEDCIVDDKFIEKIKKADAKRAMMPVKKETLTDDEINVLKALEHEASWIYLPKVEILQQLLQFFGRIYEEQNLSQSIFDAFEKGSIGIINFKKEVIIFGNTWQTLIKKNYGQGDNMMELFIKDLSKRFEEAQFYCYNKFELSYIHFKKGELVYNITQADDIQINKSAPDLPILELSEYLIKDISEKNGKDLQSFFIDCFKFRMRATVVKGQTYTQNLMQILKNEMKKDKRKY